MTISTRGVLSVLLVGTLCASACGDAASKADDGTLLSPYLAIADALAHDGTELVGELGTQVKEVASSKLAEPGVEALAKGAGQLGGQDLDTARTTFEVMSTGMIEYLRAHPDEQAGLTIVHCPMAFGGKGASWVQRQGKVMNPYEGSRMLHCGEKLDFSAELPSS